ncbi:hypothetical protein HMN09_01019600 [Mycena chlorophos]|uniref:S-adenosyl-L-methionine-dependent methyltransferase n=1 Tax=Mycena chlorophos TaxID=658473 RepID=A0A8H6SGP0_MYCCL|nr:hypothetical protein HMN09_01019600 [Mycena chlorophos]
MKLSSVLEFVHGMLYAAMISIPSVVRAVFKSPSLLLNPTEMSRIGMAAIWVLFGAGGDEGKRALRQELITPNAQGIVLDIGHGHAANYLDHEKVSKYVALEPNTHMHARLREIAEVAGFREDAGTLLILSCGAEDADSILSAVGGPVDTMIAMYTLCSIPDPQRAIHALVERVLAPGGKLLMHEHVLSRHADVAWWQRVLTPLWRIFFDGCELHRPTDVWIRELVDGDSGKSWWQDSNMWEGEARAMLPNMNGIFTRSA